MTGGHLVLVEIYGKLPLLADSFSSSPITLSDPVEALEGAELSLLVLRCRELPAGKR